MIGDKRLLGRAKKYAADAKPETVHPDVAAQLARYGRAVESGDAYTVQAHASALMRLVDALGDANVSPEPEPVVTRPARKSAAKRAPAKKTAAKRSTSSRG